MGFKRYVVFSVILMVLVYGYVFTLELGNYRLELLDIGISLPVSVWFILPVALLFIATIGHIVFYGLLNIFKERCVRKDHETMILLLKSILLEKPNTVKFRTKEFRNLSAILNQFNLQVKDGSFSSSDEELNKIVATVQDIKNGKFSSEKSVKIADNSDLAKQNLKNKINEQVDFALDIVKKPENYSNELVKVAFDNVLKEKSMTTIKKVYKNVLLDKESAKKLFQKDASNNEFGFTTEEILKIVKDLDFKSEDFIFLAKTYETILKPDQIIGLFEKLSSEIEDAMGAYLHVLFEYEMITKIKEVLSTTSENEYAPFKALLELKEAGKNYTLEAISYK